MKLIDLTHTICRNTAVFPGDDPLQLEKVRTIEKDGYNDFSLTTGMHTGSHIDGPMHMIPDNHMISELPLEMFAGKGVIIDVRGELLIEFRESYRSIIQPESIVLFFSGSDDNFGKPGYFANYPDISEELGRFLVQIKVKMVGLDWPSPDHHPHIIHQLLLSNNILVLENLTNLDQLISQPNFEVYAFPLKIEADSSIVRAVAIVT